MRRHDHHVVAHRVRPFRGQLRRLPEKMEPRPPEHHQLRERAAAPLDVVAVEEAQLARPQVVKELPPVGDVLREPH